MKKKILICTLSLLITFTSTINSFANPLILGKVAEVSIIYSIGRLAFDTVGFVGAVSDIMDLGGSIYSKMTDKQKEDYKNSVKFDDDKFTYSDDSYSYISSYVPSSNGQHLMEGIRKIVYPSTRFFDSGDKYYETSDIKLIFDDYKFTVNIQGYNLEFFVQRRDYNITDYRYYIFYKLAGDSIDNIVRIDTRSIKKSDVLWFELYYTDIRNNKATLNFDVYYGNLNSSTYYTKKIISSNVPSYCEFCPHHVSLSPSYKYPTSSELEEIEKNYPQYKNDILVPGDDNNNGGGSNDNNNGGSNGDDTNNGGSDGDSSNGDINNSPIISNPPSFPDLQEFDFRGLKLEPLTNLFSNLKNKFPFSLPFDLANLIGVLNQDPVAPVFKTEIFNYEMVMDFTQFEFLAELVRGFTLLSYVVSLIFITKRFGG